MCDTERLDLAVEILTQSLRCIDTSSILERSEDCLIPTVVISPIVMQGAQRRIYVSVTTQSCKLVRGALGQVWCVRSAGWDGQQISTYHARTKNEIKIRHWHMSANVTFCYFLM